MNATIEMTNSTGEKCDFPSTGQFWLSGTPVLIFILAGLSIQIFIVAVNVIDWLKGRLLTVADLIITYIGITRIILYVTCPFYLLTYICSAGLRVIIVALNLLIGITSFFSSIWLSSLLSIYFCLKISTFHNDFFLRLKTVISQRVACLIFACVMLAFGYTIMFSLVVTHTLFGNSGNYDQLIDNRNFPVIFTLSFLGNIFPILMFFASSVILVISLSLHIRQMKTHGNAMSSTDTYYKMIMFTAMSFLTCALCIIVNVSEKYVKELFGIMWTYVFWFMFPFIHSLSLIYITTKLRDCFIRIFHWGMDCLLRRKASEPVTRGPMEMIPL